MQIAERMADGNFTDQIASARRDELDRLPGSLASMQFHLEARVAEDGAMMTKLDAVLNNMKLGLSMFGPDNRLILWNDPSLKMHGIAPGRIHAGCTLEERFEARKSQARHPIVLRRAFQLVVFSNRATISGSGSCQAPITDS